MSGALPAAGAEDRATPYDARGPEALLRLENVVGHAGSTTGTMQTGAWCTGPDGAFSFGVIGVLIDDVWGGAAVACAPDGWDGSSTEMTASFGALPPADGSLLYAQGGAVQRDPWSALATGTVRTADGRLVAAGSQRTRYRRIDAPIPQEDYEEIAASPELSISELLGLEPDTLGGSDELVFTGGRLHSNPAGNIHGGILFCVSELAATRAVNAAGPILRPTSLQIIYIRPGFLGEPVRCETEVIYRGRTAAAAEVRCLRADGKACAVTMLSYGPVEVSNG